MTSTLLRFGPLAAVAALFLAVGCTTTTDRAPLTSYNSSSLLGTPPLTFIESPSDGSTFPAGKRIAINAGANSFSGIARVDFIVNGAVIASDSRRPFRTTYRLPAAGKYVLHSVAYGYYGASKSSPGVVIYAD